MKKIIEIDLPLIERLKPLGITIDLEDKNHSHHAQVYKDGVSIGYFSASSLWKKYIRCIYPKQ